MDRNVPIVVSMSLKPYLPLLHLRDHRHKNYNVVVGQTKKVHRLKCYSIRERKTRLLSMARYLCQWPFNMQNLANNFRQFWLCVSDKYMWYTLRNELFHRFYLVSNFSANFLCGGSIPVSRKDPKPIVNVIDNFAKNTHTFTSTKYNYSFPSSARTSNRSEWNYVNEWIITIKNLY